MFAACGSSDRARTDGAGDGGSAFAEGGSGFGDGSVPGSGRLCDAATRNVIDDHGNVVQACGATEACSNGNCVDACQAASDAKGSLGCSFLFSTPVFPPSFTQPCFAAFIANSGASDAKVTVKRAGTTFDVTTFGRIPDGTATVANWKPVPATGLPPSQVAVLFLSADPTSNHPNGGSLACPITPAVNSATATNGTGLGSAFEITTNVPVTAYDIHPFGGARSYLPSAELVLPTTSWGTNFVAVGPLASDPETYFGQVVAAEDGTTVDVVPTVNLPSAGAQVPAGPANTKTTYTLNAGEFIHWGLDSDMSGSILSSNKPIAYVGGSWYVCLSSNTSGGGGCDANHQLVPPVNALGNEYAVAPYLTRRADLMDESVPHRIVGVVDGTTLTYEPPVPGAPGSLSKGQVVRFEATGGFVVKSQDAQHPFYVGQAMTGCYVTSGSRRGCSEPPPDGLDACLGDEEFVVVLPPGQYLNRYVFFTDSTYATTNLVLTRAKTASGFKDVTVDCLGLVTGWKPLGTSGSYEQTTIDLVRANIANGTCSNGGHTAQSDGPFGITVWGLDAFSSYAYPAGGNVAALNQVYVPPVPK